MKNESKNVKKKTVILLPRLKNLVLNVMKDYENQTNGIIIINFLPLQLTSNN